MADFIRIHPGDNVAVALKAIPAGTEFMGSTSAIDNTSASTRDILLSVFLSIYILLWDRFISFELYHRSV